MHRQPFEGSRLKGLFIVARTEVPDPISKPTLSRRFVPLCHACERFGIGLDVGLETAVGPQELDVGTVRLDLALLSLLHVLIAAQGGEAPVLGHNDLLAAREPNRSCQIGY